jgi:hypothetical protein
LTIVFVVVVLLLATSYVAAVDVLKIGPYIAVIPL